MPSRVGRTCRFNFPFSKNKKLSLFETVLSPFTQDLSKQKQTLSPFHCATLPRYESPKKGMLSPTKPF